MLRAIIRRRHKVFEDAPEIAGFFTFDFEAPDLEALLLKGGIGPGTYEFNELVDVEILGDLRRRGA